VTPQLAFLGSVPLDRSSAASAAADSSAFITGVTKPCSTRRSLRVASMAARTRVRRSGRSSIVRPSVRIGSSTRTSVNRKVHLSERDSSSRRLLTIDPKPPACVLLMFRNEVGRLNEHTTGAAGRVIDPSVERFQNLHPSRPPTNSHKSNRGAEAYYPPEEGSHFSPRRPRSPASRPTTTACASVEAPSLCRIRRRTRLIVRPENPTVSAISGGVNPFIMQSRTSNSLVENCLSPSLIVAHSQYLAAVIEYGHMLGLTHTTGGITRETLTPGITRRPLQPYDIVLVEEMYACHPPGIYGCV